MQPRRVRPSPTSSVVLRRCAWGCAALVVGCAPALDWRETRLPGPGLEATFPCRPVGQTRQIELAGRSVAMHLHGCETGGRTFAVGWADVADPSAVGPVLEALRRANAAKAGGQVVRPVADWTLPRGATPQAAAGRWQLRVPGVEGAALAMDTAVFARGTWVVQASVIGLERDLGAAEPWAPFFDGLRFSL